MITAKQELGMVRVSGLKNPRTEAERYRLANPEYIQAARSNRYRHNIKQFIYFAKVDGDDLLVPTPCYLMHLPEWAEQTPADTNAGSNNTLELRDYQLRALSEWTSKDFGILRACAGSGKTVMGCKALEEKGVKSIVIVPSQDILLQWYDTARELFGFTFDRLGGKFKEATPESDFIVSTYQSAILNPELLKNRGFVLIDEAHRTSCISIRTILELCPARYRYGVTATPWRADGLHDALNWLLGGITSVIERDEIGEHLSHPKIIQRNSGFAMDVPMKRGAFGRRATFDSAEYQTLISEHSARNQLLANIVKGRVQQGHSVICLGHRIEQLTDIKRKLNDTGRPVVVHGAMKKSIREACMEAMREQRSRVLLATFNLAGEGLDIPALSCLVYASPNGNPTRTEQSCGRVARPMQGKNEPIVVDLIDGDRKSLQYKKQREEVYSSLGYEVEMEQV